MTVIYELHLDILKMYLHTRNEVSRSKLSKVEAEQTFAVGKIRMQTLNYKLTFKDSFEV